MTKRTTNTTNEKALGRESEGYMKRTVNVCDFNPPDADQLSLDLDSQRDKRGGEPSSPLRRGDKPRSKLETMLALFVQGRNFNRFEAENHHDHCLHSTVSTLQNGYGIKIDRVSETVPCLRGRSTVTCKRYWLDTSPDNITAARALLGMMGRS